MRRTGIFVALVACVGLLVATAATGCVKPEPEQDICDEARGVIPDANAAMAALIVDRTNSSRTDLGIPPALVDAIAEVQEAGVTSGKGSQVKVIPVVGAGEYPPPTKLLAIDLEPGNTSQDAADVRKKLARDCLPKLIADAPTTTAPTTDLIGALLAAKQENPEKILVLSGGLNTTEGADLRGLTDPTGAAKAVRAATPGFSQWNVPVAWFNLGEPRIPLSDEDREYLIRFWKELLGDKLSNDTKEGGQDASPPTTPQR